MKEVSERSEHREVAEDHGDHKKPSESVEDNGHDERDQNWDEEGFKEESLGLLGTEYLEELRKVEADVGFVKVRNLLDPLLRRDAEFAQKLISFWVWAQFIKDMFATKQNLIIKNKQ